MTDKSGVLYEGGCSAVGYKPIVGHVVPDRMGEIVAGGCSWRDRRLGHTQAPVPPTISEACDNRRNNNLLLEPARTIRGCRNYQIPRPRRGVSRQPFVPRNPFLLAGI